MFARSMTPGLKHSVLVTHAMSDGAMSRLETFFDVETRVEARVPSGDELVNWLCGKAGVIADTRFVFDAQVVARLPLLKAICNLDAEHHNLDLPALTSAGIRATSTPAPDSARLSSEAGADSAWQLLAALLQRALPLAGAEGRYSSRWSRQVLLKEPLQMLQVGMLGAGALADALAARVQAARVQLLGRTLAREAFWRHADVVVCAAVEPVRLSAADMALMKPSARILNLAGADALAADVLGNPALMRRVDSSDVALAREAAPVDELLTNRTRVAAEDLIAALGFGRNSWHPRHLLNPDILCESCC
jgi:gluconate 2-dehydrogenase